MRKLLICLLGLPLALSGCVSDEEMAASRTAYPESLGHRMMDEEQQRENIQGLTCSLGMAAAAFAQPQNRAGVVESTC
jgi:hypothetical protein